MYNCSVIYNSLMIIYQNANESSLLDDRKASKVKISVIFFGDITNNYIHSMYFDIESVLLIRTFKYLIDG